MIVRCKEKQGKLHFPYADLCLIYNNLSIMILECDDWIFIQEIIEKLSRNELSKEDYPCLNDPSPSYHGSPYSGPVNQNPHSMRSRRTPTWARPRGSEDGYSRYNFLSSLVTSNLIASDEISLFFPLALWLVIIALTELCRDLFQLAIIVDNMLKYPSLLNLSIPM